MLWWMLPFVLLVMLASWVPAAWVLAAGWRVLDCAPEDTISACEETPKPKPRSSAQECRRVDPLLMAFLTTGAFMQAFNFTIAMPSSEQIMVAAGGTTFLSGLCIGMYPLGSILCLPAMLHFSRHSYRGGCIFMAATAVLGNIAYGVAASTRGSSAILGMLLARMFCGFEGGGNIVFSNAAVRLSSGAGTARAVGALVASVCVGLVAGPAVASLCQQLFPHARPEIPPSLLMTVFGGLYGVAAWICIPSQEEVFNQACLAGQVPAAAPGAPAAAPGAGAAPTDVQVREAWLHLAVQCILYACRFFQRVAWEMGALLVLQRTYGISTKRVGFLVVLPVLGALPLLLSSDFLHRLGPLLATRLLGFFELVGILLMFRLDLPEVWQLVVFLLGSWLFYAANWASSVPVAALRQKFALKDHWLLNVEMTTAALWISGFLGTFYGPVLSRAVLDGCTSQNLLAATCLVAWAGISLAVEVGLHVLLRQGTSV